MRERILKEVKNLALEPEESDHLDYLNESTGLSKEKITAYAGKLLKVMIQYYDQISVSTIDSFFQRVLRSFARDLGIDTAYRVQLDTDEVIEQAAVKLIRDIDKNHPLYSWLSREMQRKINEGKKFHVKSTLMSLASQLYAEDVDMDALQSLDFEELRSLFKELQLSQIKIKNQNLKYISRAEEFMEEYGFILTDFSSGKSGFMGALINHDEPENLKKVLKSKTLQKVIDDSHKMYANKNKARADEYLRFYNEALKEHIDDYVAFVSKAYQEYTTNKAILEELVSYITLYTLIPYLNEVKRENNWLILAETNRFLRDLMETVFVPFLYEKISVAYRHLLIDEFQDTSLFQWQNLRPLIDENMSQNYDNLIVGDVKQAIYRFRNGNWEILQSGLEQLYYGAIESETLTHNFRSDEHVITFNNRLFDASHLPDIIQDSLEWVWEDKKLIDEDETMPPIGEVADIYADSKQYLPEVLSLKEARSGKGYVEVNFLKRDKIDKRTGEIIYDNEQLYREKLYQIFLQLQNNGYKPGDIAILCERKKNIKDVVEIIEEIKANPEEYPGIKPEFLNYVNNEALLLSNDRYVRFIIANLQMMVEPEEPIHHYEVVYLAEEDYDFKDNKEEMADYIKVWRERQAEIEGSSLVEIAQSLLNYIPQEELEEHAIYLHSFFEELLQYQAEHGSFLSEFLDWWEEEKVTLTLPDNVGAMEIMTVHKAKGLAFPIVILPFLDWKFGPEHSFKNTLWVDYEQDKLQLKLPIDWSYSTLNSDFTDVVFEEVENSHIDSLNLLYVAMTRAKNEIYALATVPSDDKDASQDNMNTALSKYLVEPMDDLSKTEDEKGITTYAYGKQEGRVEPNDPEPAALTLGMTEYRTALPQLRALAWEEDTLAPDSERKERVLRGNAVHTILENTEYLEDLDKAIKTAVLEGTIPASEQEKWQEHFHELFSNPEISNLFSTDYKVLRERRITLPTGKSLKPDRVIMKENEVHIIDYKSSETKNENKKYAKQVMRYKEVFEEMGYENVKASLLYTQLAELERIA